MNNDDKQKAAWQRAITEDMMVDEFNLISPEFLQQTRINILVAMEEIKRVDVSYDPNTFMMIWEVKFKVFKMLLKSKTAILDKLRLVLTNRFPHCSVEVRELEE